VPRIRVACVLMVGLMLGGCSKAADSEADGDVRGPGVGPGASTTPAPMPRADVPRTADALHAALKGKNPAYTGEAPLQQNGDTIVALDLRESGVTDLSPLAGLALQVLYAEQTGVVDLEPLRGMPLVELSLSDSPVENIDALRGMPLESLRLVNTKVRDVSPLRGAPLRELWLNNTPVVDISALAGAPLISLTVEGTRVSDIEVVRRLPLLERLNLSGAPVSDLGPVAGLNLTRLVFNPQTATKGLDAARALPACREIGPTMDQMTPPAQFWPAYDAGAFR